MWVIQKVKREDRLATKKGKVILEKIMGRIVKIKEGEGYSRYI